MAVSELAWKYYRLKSMSLAEVPYRVFNGIRGRFRRNAAKARRTVDQFPVRFSHPRFRPETFLAHLRSRSAPNFYVDVNSRVSAEAGSDRNLSRQTLEKAQRVLDGHIDIGALVFRGTPPDWHVDPTTHLAWPTVFHGDIRVRDRDEIGDVRAVWEVNRMQWLFDVAKCYWVTEDDRYAEFAEKIIEHWIEANPIDLGVNWKSGMEAAIRAQTWLWLAFLLCFSDRPRLSAVLVHGIWSHIIHVEANLSRFSSANNHLMIEAATLFIAGVLFPEFEASARWRRTGERIIEHEALRQIRPDGVSAEQSIHYHAFVLEALLMMALLAERNGIHLAPSVLERIRGMLRFLGAVTDSNGRVPAIGDSDDGRVSPLSREDESYYTYLLTLGSKFGDGLRPGDHFSERARWVAGGDTRTARGASEAHQDSLVMTVFSDSGYVAIREASSHRRMIFDAGPHGLDRLCAHAHADALSVTLSVYGIDVLIDPGTHVYNIRRAERDALRSTEAHNTVVVDERSQSESAGPFVWLTKTDALLEHSAARSWFAFAVGHHDGYKPVRHTRMVLAVAHDLLIMVDRLHGDKGAHSYLQTFSLGKGMCPRAVNGGWVLEQDAETVATLLMSSWPGLSLATRPVPVSRRFLELHTTHQLTSRTEAEGEFRMITACHTGTFSPVLTERGEGVLRVEYGGRSRYVLTGKYQSDELQFEGDFLYLECTDQGGLDRLFAHGCRSLLFRGQDMKRGVTGPYSQLTVD